MKRLLLVVLALFISDHLAAQCNPYYQLEEGMVMEMTNYNSKDKKEGRQVTTITSFEQESSGWTAMMNVEVFDKKDRKILHQQGVEIACENGLIMIDMERFMPQETMQAFKDMDMDIQLDNLELPADLSVGQELDGGGMTMTGNLPMKMETTIYNRKVASEETITTPAGTFECFVITYDMDIKMGMTRSMKGKEWIAKEVGVVKQVSYKSNGNMMGYSLLTNVK